MCLSTKYVSSCQNVLGLLQPHFRLEVFRKWPQQCLPSNVLLKGHSVPPPLEGGFFPLSLNLGGSFTPLTNSLWQKWHCDNSGPALTQRLPFPACWSPEAPHKNPRLWRSHTETPSQTSATRVFSDSSPSHQLATTTWQILTRTTQLSPANPQTRRENTKLWL